MLKFIRNIKVRVHKIWDNNMKTFIVSQYHIRFPFPLSKCYHTDILDCLGCPFFKANKDFRRLDLVLVVKNVSPSVPID